MFKRWGFYNPVSIHFGTGIRQLLKSELKKKRCLVVTSKRGRVQIESDSILSEIIADNNIEWVDNVESNPCINFLQSSIDKFCKSEFDLILGFGGGSAIDAAKAFSVVLSKSMPIKNIKQLLKEPSLHQSISSIPLYVLPTTSGTGSEVTPFATIWDHNEKKKYSLAGENIFPKKAFVDPELSFELPLEPSISTGLDAINQAAESIWNNNSNPITFSYAAKALKLGIPALLRLKENKHDHHARVNMAECSLLAGLAISHTRTALCHSISYPLTAHFNIPHGLACAFTMPYVLRLNIKADDGRFIDLKNDLGVDDLIALFDKLNDSMSVREKIKAYITSFSALSSLVHEMYTPDRANNNLTDIDLDSISLLLRESWGEDSQC